MLPMSRYEEEGNKGLRSDGVFVWIVAVTDTNDDVVCDLNGDDYHDSIAILKSYIYFTLE